MVSKEPQELRTRLSVSLRPLIFSLLEEEPEATLMAPRLWMTPLRLAPIAPGTRPGRHQQETAEAVGVLTTPRQLSDWRKSPRRGCPENTPSGQSRPPELAPWLAPVLSKRGGAGGTPAACSGCQDTATAGR